MRRLLGVLVGVLLAAGATGAMAAEDDPPGASPPPADVLGTPWFADPTNPPAPAGAVDRATWSAPPTLDAAPQDEHPRDLPPGLPAAAYAREPKLPEPKGWAFGSGFPRTSGTGRHDAGALLWSDFLYDDNGAIGVIPPTNESTGAPSLGTYRYPEPAAMRNGADLFRVGIGRRGATSTWRVDWNTLADPNVPLAVFTLDTDPATGVDDWPANAGLRSPGIDWAVVVSGTSARVLDLVGGTTHPATLRVDLAARSFVATTSAVPTGGRAAVRIAAGLADDAGTALRTLDATHGALPGQPNVYNVGFRDYEDEPSVANTWYDSGQAQTLTAGGDVSAFATVVEWADLDRRRTDPEPLLPGYTNRWYVSSWPQAWDAPGRPALQGIADPGQGISTNGPAAYVGRVQPYAVFVPSTYVAAADRPAPLTMMLHGASSSHNSAQIHPRYNELACERRRSICVNPLGRGPSGGWRDYAELDAWEVWNRVASTYALDPDGTILHGISMGGFGTYKLAMDHPEAFTAAVTIVAHAGQAETGHDRLPNLRWTPLYARHGAFDQLVPITDEMETQAELDRLGLRHVYDFQPAEDHIAVALKDGYDDIAEFMADVDRRHRRQAVPPRIDYAWDQPTPARLALGLDRPGAWWLDDVAARDATARARISARSLAIEDPAITLVDRTEPRLLGSPTPAIRHAIDWLLGEAPPTRDEAELTLVNVGALTLDAHHARLEPGATATVTTDGPVRLTIGSTTYDLTAGTTTVTLPST